MMELLVDYRIGGHPRYYLGELPGDGMQIPDEIRKCVVFVCYDSGQGLKFAGTAFFLAIPLSDGSENGSFVYLMTANHVIAGIKTKSVDQIAGIRINTRDGGYRFIETKVDQWISHPDDPYADIAVLPWAPDPTIFDWLSIPLNMAVTQDVVNKEALSVGDEVFLTGLFSSHYGRNKNVPIVRVGNIALMPDEPIKTTLGPMLAYLVESRSIGGLSGSPVFLHLFGPRTVSGVSSLMAGARFYWLGLMHGHWDLPTSDLDTADASTGERLNMGIAIVVPATKILEVINQPGLIEQRKTAEEQRRKGVLPTPDSIVPNK